MLHRPPTLPLYLHWVCVHGSHGSRYASNKAQSNALFPTSFTRSEIIFVFRRNDIVEQIGRRSMWCILWMHVRMRVSARLLLYSRWDCTITNSNRSLSWFALIASCTVWVSGTHKNFLGYMQEIKADVQDSQPLRRQDGCRALVWLAPICRRACMQLNLITPTPRTLSEQDYTYHCSRRPPTSHICPSITVGRTYPMNSNIEFSGFARVHCTRRYCHPVSASHEM